MDDGTDATSFNRLVFDAAHDTWRSRLVPNYSNTNVLKNAVVTYVYGTLMANKMPIYWHCMFRGAASK